MKFITKPEGAGWDITRRQIRMKKTFKVMGLMALVMTAAFVLSAFTKANNDTDVSSGDQYSCKVEIFLPDGSHFVSGNMTVYFHKASWTDEGGWAKYWVDGDGKCTMSWDAKRGDYIERITFCQFGTCYEIKDVKLSDGGNYKLTARES